MLMAAGLAKPWLRVAGELRDGLGYVSAQAIAIVPIVATGSGA
jgi:hypothetical protein